MNFTVNHAVALGCALAIGYYIGRHGKLTRSQTNASGVPTTAYVGAGPLGTLGAVANSASNGWLASAGESLGGWFYDVFNGNPFASPSTSPVQSSADIVRGGPSPETRPDSESWGLPL